MKTPSLWMLMKFTKRKCDRRRPNVKLWWLEWVGGLIAWDVADQERVQLNEVNDEMFPHKLPVHLVTHSVWYRLSYPAFPCAQHQRLCPISIYLISLWSPFSLFVTLKLIFSSFAMLKLNWIQIVFYHQKMSHKSLPNFKSLSVC